MKSSVMQGIFCIAIFFLSSAAVADISYLEIDQPSSALYQPIGDTSPVSPPEIIEIVKVEEVDLDAKSRPNQGMIFVTTLNGKYVDFGKYVAAAVPFKLVSKGPISEIVIRSHYVKPAGGEGFVLFPLVTTLDASGNVIEMLEPNEGSKAKGNTVHNYFSLPPQTEYILVHSRPDLISAEFWKASVKNQ